MATSRMTPGELRKKLGQIRKAFEKAENAYLTIPENVRNNLNDVHNYEGTINYCYSYGMQACDELAEENLKRMTEE